MREREREREKFEELNQFFYIITKTLLLLTMRYDFFI